MLSQLQASYQRVEQSLQRLTDSIAAYNPSTSAADDLVAADDELNDNLEQLVEHQRNVLRIEELQRIAQENDDKIKNHFRAVADLRKELNGIPSTDSTTSARDVSVDELLSYARFISPTTVPPTFRKQDVSLKAAQGSAATQPTNGIATPPPAAQDEVTKPTDVSAALSTITETDKAWLNPLANLPFEPWPSHLIIANGALANIQAMVEQGKDPASVLSAEEQAEADRKRKEEEEKERLEDEERQRRRMSMFDTVGRRRREEQSDVFDPDDL